MAGAILANAPTLILAFIFSFIEFEVPISILSTFAFVSIFSGAIIAGFLVAGRANTHYVRVGVMTGLFSFLLYGILVTFIFGDKTGGVWLVIGFVLGGCIGGTLRRSERSKTRKAKLNRLDQPTNNASTKDLWGQPLTIICLKITCNIGHCALTHIERF